MMGSHIAFIAKRATMLAIAELINDPGKSKSGKLSVAASHFNAALKEVREKEGFSSC
jgi:SpoVK/Ycf46/Vps4 family AAA+-type ATPase